MSPRSADEKAAIAIFLIMAIAVAIGLALVVWNMLRLAFPTVTS